MLKPPFHLDWTPVGALLRPAVASLMPEPPCAINAQVFRRKFFAARRSGKKKGVGFKFCSCGAASVHWPVELVELASRTEQESVGTILLSCLGGRASLFKVKLMQNWSFKFSVSSKENFPTV